MSDSVYMYAGQQVTVDNLSLYRIDTNRIARYKTEIAHMLWVNKCQRIGLITTAAAITVGGIYKLFSADTVQEKIVLNSEEVTEQLTIAAAGVAANKRLLTEIAKKIGIEVVQKPVPVATKTVSYGALFLNWTKSISRSMRDQIVTVGLMGFIAGPFSDVWHWGERSLQRLYHAGDFYWFLKKKTHTLSCLDEVTRCVEELALVLDDNEREHKKKATDFAVLVMAQELEKVIAFMEYQSESVHALYPRYAIQMRASTKAFAQKLISFIKDIDQLLSDSKKHTELVGCVGTFREKLRKEQDSFCTYESAALWDISDSIG